MTLSTLHLLTLETALKTDHLQRFNRIVKVTFTVKLLRVRKDFLTDCICEQSVYHSISTYRTLKVFPENWMVSRFVDLMKALICCFH